MKKTLNLKDEYFPNTCIKCGAMYSGIQECVNCYLVKNGIKCKICKTIYDKNSKECPFKELHYTRTLSFKIKRFWEWLHK